jgi:glycosyltransferase involved in cell wall biosynthesis
MSADLTAIVTTHNRPDGCLRAVRSVLDQHPAPREVVVCDDGSTDDTPRLLAELAAGDDRVRVHRFDPGRGGPGPGRNAGIRMARTEWVAFLDDDDAWLPGKVAAQRDWFDDPSVDVIGTNALRSDGAAYFPPGGAPRRPRRDDVLAANPLIVSSVAVRRRAMAAIGGFDERPWMGGIADYDAWLRLADAGCGFLVLPEPLIAYDDAGSERYSASRRRMQRALIRHGWRRWAGRPLSGADLLAAVRRTTDYGLIALEDVRRR